MAASRARSRVVAAGATSAAVAGILLFTGGAALADDGGRTVYVSASGHSGHSGDGGGGCGSAKYSTIQDAVNAAHAWGTVVVCKGTYREDVMVAKALTLRGRGGATIDATGLENAVQVVSSHVTVEGLRVQNANGEGVLVGVDSMADAHLLTSQVLTRVSVDHVTAKNNNKGFIPGQEQGNCKYPGDCGGGIHLNVTAWSEVTDSVVTGNADGILLTDDYGPNHHNVVSENYVADNTHECGIVLPSHSSNAVTFNPTTFAVTGRNPSQGGVYDNKVIDNITVRNGTDKAPPQFGGGGSGSGIGIFGSGPGSAAYDNLVEGNYSAGNGLAGFTIHAHHPGGEDVNGNQVVDNRFGTNNLLGDGYDGPPVVDFKTTGIAVFSVPTVTMTIKDNTISNNEIGIWLSKTVTAKGLQDNRFYHVGTKVVTG